MPPLTALTDPATRADALTAQDYRDLYTELREHLSLTEFVARTGSTVSKSWWCQYEANGKRLTAARKNELRAAVGLPLLAPDVSTVLAAVPDTATVYQVGAGAADRVLLLTPATPHGLFLHVNGDVHITDGSTAAHAADAEVTPITGHQRTRPRPDACTLPLRKATRARLAALKTAGETWDGLLNRLAEAR